MGKAFRPRVILTFPGGAKVIGSDPTEALARLGDLQWEPQDVPGMKRRLSDRAWAWNRSVLSPDLGDTDFLLALNETGMVAVLWHPRSARPEAREHPPLSPDD